MDISVTRHRAVLRLAGCLSPWKTAYLSLKASSAVRRLSDFIYFIFWFPNWMERPSNTMHCFCSFCRRHRHFVLLMLNNCTCMSRIQYWIFVMLKKQRRTNVYIRNCTVYVGLSLAAMLSDVRIIPRRWTQYVLVVWLLRTPCAAPNTILINIIAVFFIRDCKRRIF